MRYEGAVYRPPSEARSLIIQVTIGCAHNQCTFCTMYKDKQFRMRSKAEIFADLDEMAMLYRDYSLRIFLADGDALVLPTKDLVEILNYIKAKFPHVQRITSYATALDVLNKSLDELCTLKDAGLDMVYVGAESGDPEILKEIHKNVMPEDLVKASQMLKRSGIALSLTLISGLGGKRRLKEHALACAKLVTAMQPEYVGFLTLMLDDTAPIMKKINSGEMILLSPEDIVEEMRLFLNNVDSPNTVFRSNHASNYIILKGTLNKDIPQMLAYLDDVAAKGRYRSEKSRLL